MKTYSIYGNCQAIALAKTLSTCDDFKREYTFIRTKPVHRISQHEFDEFVDTLAPSLSFVLSQPVSNDFRGGGFSSEKLQIVSNNFYHFPSIQYHGYFLGLRAIKLPSSVGFREQFRKQYGVSFTDIMHFNYILKAYLHGWSVQRTAEMFYRKDLFSREEVNAFSSNSLSYLLTKERSLRLDFPLSSYIRENLAEQRLFYTYRHPTSSLLKELAVAILKRIGFEDFEESRMLKKDSLNHISYPIQRSIEEHLDLKFSDFFLRINDAMFDVKEMVEFYYSIYSTFDESSLSKFAKDV